MHCKECYRDITEEESKLYDGYCKKCYKINQDYLRETENSDGINQVSSTIKTISTVLKVLGYIGTFVLLFSLIYLFSFLTGILSALIEAFIIFIITTLLDGFAEIIQLLEDIKNK